MRLVLAAAMLSGCWTGQQVVRAPDPAPRVVKRPRGCEGLRVVGPIPEESAERRDGCYATLDTETFYWCLWQVELDERVAVRAWAESALTACSPDD